MFLNVLLFLVFPTFSDFPTFLYIFLKKYYSTLKYRTRNNNTKKKKKSSLGSLARILAIHLFFSGSRQLKLRPQILIINKKVSLF